MQSELYASTQNQIVLICSLLTDIPLIEFIKEINHCEAVAPIIAPTLFNQGSKNLEQVKIRAQALLEAQNYLRKHGHAFTTPARDNRTNASPND